MSSTRLTTLPYTTLPDLASVELTDLGNAQRLAIRMTWPVSSRTQRVPSKVRNVRHGSTRRKFPP
jgi:hypothetical protein